MSYTRTLERIRAEYLEMPGLRLTLRQAQHLCSVDPALCQSVFNALIGAQFLYLTTNGMYGRMTREHMSVHSIWHGTDDGGEHPHVSKVTRRADASQDQDPSTRSQCGST